jgi:hypothetical protein
MAAWGAVAIIMVGIAPGLLVFSAGITGGFLLRALPPPRRHLR